MGCRTEPAIVHIVHVLHKLHFFQFLNLHDLPQKKYLHDFHVLTIFLSTSYIFHIRNLECLVRISLVAHIILQRYSG